MTTYIRWLPENDDAVRAAYSSLGIGETIQVNPTTLADGSLLVGSSILTMEQASTLPVLEASPEWQAGWVVGA